MKNQPQDLKISLILSKAITNKNLLLLLVFLSLLLVPQFSFADVFVPTDEYVGYFDSNRIYTVVGNIKNEFDFAIVPIISVSVRDDSKVFSQTITHVSLASGTEIPFKIKFPEISGDNPILLSSELSFEITKKDTVPIIALMIKL